VKHLASNPESVGLLISSARRRIKQAVLARAAPHRLALQQFWLLITLAETPGLSQVELAERVQSDPPTVSRVIAVLSRRRLVRADPDPEDGRRIRLSLTVGGKRLASDLLGIAEEIRSAVIDGLREPELEALRGGLRQVIANLERLAATGPNHAVPGRAKGQS
jgi:DNA-binding MarR family transcriptional regulator